MITLFIYSVLSSLFQVIRDFLCLDHIHLGIYEVLNWWDFIFTMLINSIYFHFLSHFLSLISLRHLGLLIFIVLCFLCFLLSSLVLQYHQNSFFISKIFRPSSLIYLFKFQIILYIFFDLTFWIKIYQEIYKYLLKLKK